MKQRLEQFLSAENLTRAQFADSINVARAAISHIMAGRNNPSYEFIVNTMTAYPTLNIEWLLKGKGKMYKGQENTSQSCTDTEYDLFSDSQEDIKSEIDTKPIDVKQVMLPKPVSGAKIRKIVVLFDDDTYQEFS